MNILDRVVVNFLSLPFLVNPIEYGWHLYHVARLNGVVNHNHKELFKDVIKNHLDISSDFPKRDAIALENVARKVLKDRVSVAEIGSWKGMSTAVIAKTVSLFKGNVYAIDHWQGSTGVPEHKQAKIIEMFSVFRKNMEFLNLMDYIHPLVMSSENASAIFKDKSLDMVFIDADHRYSYVKHDIEAWLPKLKSGGIIAGHDCEGFYTHFGSFKNQIDVHCEEDVIVGICHPGVVKALYEVFGDNYNIEPDSSIWWFRKPNV